MQEPYVVVLLTLAAVLVLSLIVLLIKGRGSLARFVLARQVFGRTMADPAFAERIQPLLAPPAPDAARKPKRSAEPLRLLALLQREGRLLDFLLEDISGASDEQVGAGVRELHRKAQGTLKEHLVLEPILP